jgi:ectoine hydroxylase-related dioxygenase (phytanoyl-CoA dioxygenase family)
MHYFSGSRRSNGCLRIVPGSHRHPSVLMSAAAQREAGTPPTCFDLDVAERRAAAGVVRPGGWKDNAPEDVQMPGEVDLELQADQLLVRHTRIFHATHINREPEARLMSHWGFKTAGEISKASSPLATGRMRFDDTLSDQLLGTLSDDQKSVLRIGADYELDPAFVSERERETGRVVWGTMEELASQFEAKASL